VPRFGSTLREETKQKIAEAHLLHGRSISSKGSTEKRTYCSWTSMRRRCLQPTDAAFSNYGGRGITICPSWMSYLSFVEDMGLCPDGMSIDRIDNNLGYCKANCRWANKQSQARNRRSNRVLTIDGDTKTLAEWSEFSGLASSTIRMRINYNGGKIDSSILAPVTRK
jgi:hypothetical protein